MPRRLAPQSLTSETHRARKCQMLHSLVSFCSWTERAGACGAHTSAGRLIAHERVLRNVHRFTAQMKHHFKTSEPYQAHASNKAAQIGLGCVSGGFVSCCAVLRCWLDSHHVIRGHSVIGASSRRGGVDDEKQWHEVEREFPSSFSLWWRTRFFFLFAQDWGVRFRKKTNSLCQVRSSRSGAPGRTAAAANPGPHGRDPVQLNITLNFAQFPLCSVLIHY